MESGEVFEVLDCLEHWHDHSPLAGGGRAACLGEGEDTAVDCHLTGLIEEDLCLLRNVQRRLQVMIQDCAEPLDS